MQSMECACFYACVLAHFNKRSFLLDLAKGRKEQQVHDYGQRLWSKSDGIGGHQAWQPTLQ